ncbi:MAG: response regulator [Rhizobiales bacterium]|nr:response regulator [Hyphomicrobiales bacterium]
MSKKKFDFGTKHILLIENNKMMRRLVREMLLNFGIKPANLVETDNVTDALQLIYNQKFDLVITDFFLGDLDGGDFTRHIRGDERCLNRKIPILLITASPNHEKVLKALESGVNELLAKPIAPSALYYRIFAMLTRPRPFVITENYVGPSRSSKRLESMNSLKDSMPAGKMRTWRKVSSTSIRYPQMTSKPTTTDPFLVS